MAKGGKYRDGRRNNKPPLEFQFKKGKSGNKRGRTSKAPPSFNELIAAELNSRHHLDVGGRQVEVPLKIVLIRQVLRLACKGHPKALGWTLEMMALAQQFEVKRHTTEQPPINRKELAKMTLSELKALYDQSFAEDGQELMLDGSTGFPGKLKS
jgi:hypothetical protein